jgi:probable HAF family extracellular repeat protein
MVDLGVLPDGIASTAYGCSADGSVVVGFVRMPGGINKAFRWTQTDGMVDLGGNISMAYGCSTDGSIIVGGTNLEAIRYEIIPASLVLVPNPSVPNPSAPNSSAPNSSSNSTENIYGITPDNLQSGYYSSSSSNNLSTQITFVTPPTNPQSGDYDSSRLTNQKADKVIRVYTNTNQSNARPTFPDYATYMRYLNGALRF